MKTIFIVSLLVLSGAFSGLLFRKYWPDAPFPAVLVVAIVLTSIAFRLIR